MLPNHVPHFGKYNSPFSPFISCPASYLCSERESYILFLCNILYIVFPHFPFIYSPELSCHDFQSSSLSQAQRQTSLPACRKANIPTIEVHLDGGKLAPGSAGETDIKYVSLHKGTYFSVFTASGSIIFCSYWIRMRRKVKSTFKLSSLLKCLWWPQSDSTFSAASSFSCNKCWWNYNSASKTIPSLFRLRVRCLSCWGHTCRCYLIIICANCCRQNEICAICLYFFSGSWKWGKA